MSCWGDLKEVFQRAVIIVRSHIEYKRNPEQEQIETRVVDLSDRDEVITARAKRNFNLVYPASRSFWLSNLLNEYSFNNYGVISMFADGLCISSGAVLLAAMASVSVSIAGVIGGVEGLVSGLHLYQFGFALTSGITLATGMRMRKFDKDRTWRKCLAIAEADLEDPQVYCSEVCLISIEQEVEGNRRQIAKYDKLANALIAKMKRLRMMCDSINSISGLPEETRLAELDKHTAVIRRWSSRISDLRAKMRRLCNRSEALQAKILQIQESVPLIELGQDMNELDNGQLDGQIEELDLEADERLLKTENNVRRLEDDLMVEAGLAKIDEDKPKLIEQ